LKIAASAVTMSQAMHDAELDGEAILEGDASAIVGDEAEAIVDAGGEAIIDGGEEETVDGLPVLAEVRPIERASAVALPAVQAAAAAATGFVAGAATVALVRRRTARKSARAQRSVPRRPVDMLPIVGSRTFLVDVHMIAKPGE
jgi:hypothetical protein